MRERRDHRVIRRQGRRTELLQDGSGVLHRVAVTRRIVTHVDIQIDEAEAKLAHLAVGRAEIARPLHLLE